MILFSYRLAHGEPNEPKRGYKMTRKDYELIAQILKAQIELSRSYGETDGELAVVNIAYDLADSLALDNPRFNRERFLIASGVNESPLEVARALLAGEAVI
jgi:hypothetical protein